VWNHTFTEATALHTVILDTLVIAIPRVSILSTLAPFIIAGVGMSRYRVFTQSTALLTPLGNFLMIAEVLSVFLTPCEHVIAGIGRMGSVSFTVTTALLTVL